MDHELAERSLSYHGAQLVDKMYREQGRSRDWQQVQLPGFLAPAPSTGKCRDQPSDENFQAKVSAFIAKKADMLFKRISKTENLTTLMAGRDRKEEDYYAVLPPLETFMDIPDEDRRKHFYQSLSIGDIVVGSVSGIQDSGLIITLSCLDNGKARDIDHLHITAFCPLREVPKYYAHEAPLQAFDIKDRVCGIVLDVHPQTEKILISLQSRSLPPALQHIKVGLITDEDFPLYYTRLQAHFGRSYASCMEKLPGLMNPSCVNYLSDAYSISDAPQPSLMRGLNGVVFPPEECAESLRKAQSSRLALKSVAEGVSKFKQGKYTEAIQHLNKALDIDGDNVEALVARGALYANNESYGRAIPDFEEALRLNPNHNNAKNYLCETLVTYGRSFMDVEKFDQAMEQFERALALDPNNRECHACLYRIRNMSPPSQAATVADMGSQEAGGLPMTEMQVKEPEDTSIERSADLLKKLIHEDETAMKQKKRKRHSLVEYSPKERKKQSRVGRKKRRSSSSESSYGRGRQRRGSSPSRSSSSSTSSGSYSATSSEKWHSSHRRSRSDSREHSGKRRSASPKRHSRQRREHHDMKRSTSPKRKEKRIQSPADYRTDRKQKGRSKRHISEGDNSLSTGSLSPGSLRFIKDRKYGEQDSGKKERDEILVDEMMLSQSSFLGQGLGHVFSEYGTEHLQSSASVREKTDQSKSRRGELGRESDRGQQSHRSIQESRQLMKYERGKILQEEHLFEKRRTLKEGAFYDDDDLHGKVKMLDKKGLDCDEKCRQDSYRTQEYQLREEKGRAQDISGRNSSQSRRRDSTEEEHRERKPYKLVEEARQTASHLTSHGEDNHKRKELYKPASKRRLSHGSEYEEQMWKTQQGDEKGGSQGNFLYREAYIYGEKGKDSQEGKQQRQDYEKKTGENVFYRRKVSLQGYKTIDQEVDLGQNETSRSDGRDNDVHGEKALGRKSRGGKSSYIEDHEEEEWSQLHGACKQPEEDSWEDIFKSRKDVSCKADPSKRKVYIDRESSRKHSKHEHEDEHFAGKKMSGEHDEEHKSQHDDVEPHEKHGRELEHCGEYDDEQWDEALDDGGYDGTYEEEGGTGEEIMDLDEALKNYYESYNEMAAKEYGNRSPDYDEDDDYYHERDRKRDKEADRSPKRHHEEREKHKREKSPPRKYFSEGYLAAMAARGKRGRGVRIRGRGRGFIYRGRGKRGRGKWVDVSGGGADNPGGFDASQDEGDDSSKGRGRGRGRGWGYGRGRGRGSGFPRGRGRGFDSFRGRGRGFKPEDYGETQPQGPGNFFGGRGRGWHRGKGRSHEQSRERTRSRSRSHDRSWSRSPRREKSESRQKSTSGSPRLARSVTPRKHSRQGRDRYSRSRSKSPQERSFYGRRSYSRSRSRSRSRSGKMICKYSKDYHATLSRSRSRSKSPSEKRKRSSRWDDLGEKSDGRNEKKRDFADSSLPRNVRMKYLVEDCRDKDPKGVTVKSKWDSDEETILHSGKNNSHLGRSSLSLTSSGKGESSSTSEFEALDKKRKHKKEKHKHKKSKRGSREKEKPKDSSQSLEELEGFLQMLKKKKSVESTGEGKQKKLEPAAGTRD